MSSHLGFIVGKGNKAVRVFFGHTESQRGELDPSTV